MSEKKETKLCKHCKTEIPAGAKICPNCKKKQGGLLKWVVIVLVAFIIIGAIGGGGDKKDANEVTRVDSSSNDTTQQTNINTEETPNDTNVENESNSVFKVGETAEYKDVQITVLSSEESEGNDWGKPEEGNVFVFPEIEIANNSDEEISISSMMSFECYVDDYKTDFSSNAFMAISTENGKQQLDGSIAPGKKLKGVLGIEVPKEWEVIEIYYKDNVWLDSNFSFQITK